MWGGGWGLPLAPQPIRDMNLRSPNTSQGHISFAAETAQYKLPFTPKYNVSISYQEGVNWLQTINFHCVVEWFNRLFYNNACILKSNLMYGRTWDRGFKIFRFDTKEPQKLQRYHCASGFIGKSNVIKISLLSKLISINRKLCFDQLATASFSTPH